MKEKINWTDSVINALVLQRVKRERNILPTIKRGKVNGIGRILCRNSLLKHVNGGKRRKDSSEWKTRKKM